MALVEKHTTYAPLLLISRGNMQFRNHLSEVRQGIVLLIPIAYRHSSVEKQPVLGDRCWYSENFWGSLLEEKVQRGQTLSNTILQKRRSSAGTKCSMGWVSMLSKIDPAKHPYLHDKTVQRSGHT